MCTNNQEQLFLCGDCNQYKSKSDFHVCFSSSRGIQSICKNCKSLRNSNAHRELAISSPPARAFRTLATTSYNHLQYYNIPYTSVLEMIGCTLEQFINFMSPQLEIQKYSWETYGKVWCWDHIVPCKALQAGVDPYLIFNYQNVQPLDKNENRKKGSSYTEEDVILLQKKVIITKKHIKTIFDV